MSGDFLEGCGGEVGIQFTRRSARDADSADDGASGLDRKTTGLAPFRDRVTTGICDGQPVTWISVAPDFASVIPAICCAWPMPLRVTLSVPAYPA